MKVLLVHPEFYAYGGAERLIVKLANYLTDKGVQNTLLTTNIPYSIMENLKDTRTICSSQYFRTGYLGIRTVLHQIASDFDIINSHNHPTELFLYPIKRPHVWQCNEPPIEVLTGEKLDPLQKEIVNKNINRVTVADEFNKERFRKLYDMESTVIPYGIDYEFFSSKGDIEKIKDKYGLEDSYILTQVGMLTFTKNQIRTIEIFENLKDKIPNLKLLLVGYDGLEYGADIKRKIQEKGLESNIIVTGELSQDEIRDIYWTSDLVLHPIKSQGGWLSTFEAMAANRLIIGSKEMTISKTLQEKSLGIVCDISDFEKNILDYYNNCDKYLITINRGAEYAKSLTWNKYCSSMLRVFREALNV